MELGESNMKGIYSRTFTVQDDKLNDAMEICKGLAEVRKVHFPDSQSYFSFQIGGNPRSFRETLIGEMFDGDYDKDMKLCEDIIKKYQKERFDQLKRDDPRSNNLKPFNSIIHNDFKECEKTLLSVCQGQFPKSKEV